MLSYLVKQDGEQPEQRQVRCFCEAGAAQNPALPFVDDVFPPQRRHNLRIKLCAGVLWGPGSYIPLVWDEKNDAPVAPAPPWATRRWKPALDGSMVLDGRDITPAPR